MIPLYKVYMPPNIEDSLIKLLYSERLAFGEHNELFEERLRKYLGTSLVITTNTNNSAMILALKLAGVKVGDDVLASPISCLATNAPVKTVGANIVWIDVNPSTGCIDSEKLEGYLTRKTKAIIHYHWVGYPGDINEINSFARKKGLKVIEDASEAFGAEYKGRKIGNTNSDFVCFSFNPVRIINTIDGGALSIRAKDDFERAKLLRDYGIDRKKFRDKMGEINPNSDITEAGHHFLMNNLSGYLGFVQILDIDRRLKRVRSNARFYDKKLSVIPQLKPLRVSPRKQPSYWVYTILAEDRDNLLIFLRENQIYASKVHMRNDIYSCFGPLKNKYPGIEEFSKKYLSIPCGWWLSKEETKKITQLIQKFYANSICSL